MILVELEYKGILQKVKVKPLVYVRTSFVLRRPFTVDLIISKPPGGDPDIVLVEEPNHVDQSLLAMFGLDLNDPGHCGGRSGGGSPPSPARSVARIGTRVALLTAGKAASYASMTWSTWRRPIWITPPPSKSIRFFTVQGDNAPLVDDRHPVAEQLDFLHVMMV